MKNISVPKPVSCLVEHRLEVAELALVAVLGDEGRADDLPLGEQGAPGRQHHPEEVVQPELQVLVPDLAGVLLAHHAQGAEQQVLGPGDGHQHQVGLVVDHPPGVGDPLVLVELVRPAAVLVHLVEPLEFATAKKDSYKKRVMKAET